MNDLNPLIEQVVPRAAVMVLYARQWLDRESARDVVQEACVSLLSLRVAPDNAIAWMYRAVRNAAIDHARVDQRRRMREQLSAQIRADWFQPNLDDLIDSQLASQALKNLPIELREPVILRIWGELGFAEIAQITGAGVATVHDRYNRALSELRKVMEKPCKK